MTEACLHAYQLDSKGGGTAIDLDNIPEGTIWVHLDATHGDARACLEKISDLDRFVIDALLAGETRPRMEELDDGILVILRGVNLNDPESPEDMVSIRLWVTENRIISTRRRKLMAVQDIEEKIGAGKGPKSSGEFLTTICSKLFDRMEPILTDLDEMTDNIEEKVLEDPDYSLRSSVVTIRKQAIMFRRYMAPQREVVSRLRGLDFEWLSTSDKRNLLESYDRVTRYVEDLDAIRERAQIVQDELNNALAERLNKNMYMVSIVAAIFLPLGFLTGLLGINIAGIPGAEYPNAFVVFCVMLAVVVVLQVVIFKKLKWF